MMPVSRFAPDLLEKYLSPASANACSIMREVVVLPFVPVTPTTVMRPAGSPYHLAASFAAAGILIGVGGSLTAIRKFLHV